MELNAFGHSLDMDWGEGRSNHAKMSLLNIWVVVELFIE
jgi:hypothetical protein